jgi:hypothetical protein
LTKCSNYSAKAFANSHSFNTLELKRFLQRIFSGKQAKWKKNDHPFGFCPRLELAQRSKTFAVFKNNKGKGDIVDQVDRIRYNKCRMGLGQGTPVPSIKKVVYSNAECGLSIAECGFQNIKRSMDQSAQTK